MSKSKLKLGQIIKILFRKVKNRALWIKSCGYCGKCKNYLLITLFGGKNKNKICLLTKAWKVWKYQKSIADWPIVHSTATPCTSLYCTAAQYSILVFNAPNCNTLDCTALYYTACTVLHCMHCTALYCTVVHCSVVLADYCSWQPGSQGTLIIPTPTTLTHCTEICCTALYCTRLHYPVLYCTVL